MMEPIELRNISHCSLSMCKKALEYAKEHNGDDDMAIACLKAHMTLMLNLKLAK